MRKRDTYLQHVPYMYLARPEGQACYHLFVAIRKQVDEVVAPAWNAGGQAIDYRDGVTAIDLLVSPRPGASENGASDFFLMRYELRPDAHAPQPFHPEAFEVEVNVRILKRPWKLQAEAYTNVMSYSDADKQPVPAGRPDSEPAYNCPYIYLEQKPAPEGAGGGQENTFCPYVLLAPKGYRLSGQKVDGPAHGALEYLLVLSKEEGAQAEGSFLPFMAPAELVANTREYPAKELPDANFAVTVTFAGNEAAADAPQQKETWARRRNTTDSERAGNEGKPSVEPPAASQNQIQKAERRAKTRNMSSRRNRA